MTVGSGQYLTALAAVLPRVEPAHEFVLVLPQARQVDVDLPAGWRAVTAGTPFDRLNGNLAKVWFEQVAFPAACRRLDAAVAFVPYWGSPWWRPCPVVVTVHDLIPLLLPLYRGGLLQRAYTRLVALTARRAAAIVTDSEASRRDIAVHLRVSPERVHAIYLAAGACEEGTRDRDERAFDERDLRVRLNLPDGPFLLYLGGFDARKNVDRTVRAYAKLVERCAAEGTVPPALVLAGKPPDVDSAFAPDPRPVIGSLGLAGRVHFAGWVDEADKAALYRLTEGVIFVSEYEGFGLPVLEAMACEGE